MANRTLLPILIALLALSAPLALAQSAYWTVVEDDAPADDVIAAANFAASMKVSAAATFTGKTRSQAADSVISQDLDDALVILFDGRSATIMAGDREEFDDVVLTAQEYFRREGFSVRNVAPDVREITLEREDDDEGSVPSDDGMDEGTSTDGEQPDLVDEPSQEQPPVPVYAPEENGTQEQPPAPQSPEADEPGFFGRIWGWFSGIFS